HCGNACATTSSRPCRTASRAAQVTAYRLTSEPSYPTTISVMATPLPSSSSSHPFGPGSHGQRSPRPGDIRRPGGRWRAGVTPSAVAFGQRAGVVVATGVGAGGGVEACGPCGRPLPVADLRRVVAVLTGVLARPQPGVHHL